jgi:hypothetical protein
VLGGLNRGRGGVTHQKRLRVSEPWLVLRRTRFRTTNPIPDPTQRSDLITQLANRPDVPITQRSDPPQAPSRAGPVHPGPMRAHVGLAVGLR